MIGEVEVLREQARIAAARGDFTTAASTLLSAASKTHAADRDYDAVLRPLADALTRAKEPRRALTVVEMLASNNPTEWKLATNLLPVVPPADRARALAAQGHAAEAAREAEAGGWIASAAFFRERDGDWPGARALWARLASRGSRGLRGGAAMSGPPASAAASELESGESMYVRALVYFNLARCARHCDDVAQLREATVDCVRLLEEAADHFESIGQRERAFDCFQVLAQVGREGGAFEDVLEGYVNSIRILREDRLKYFALQLYDEAIGAAAEHGEPGAAATLAREAADYARSLGLDPVSRRYSLRQADLWRMSARRNLERGAPTEIAENALLASVLAFGEVGQAARVGETYAELAMLDLEPGRREHYARTAKRYAASRDEPLDMRDVPARARDAGSSASAFVPASASRTAPFNEVWRLDVLEWERGGSAAEACGEIMLDTRLPEFMRRRAMLARLTALEAEDHAGDRSPDAEALRVRLAHELGQVQLYAVLSPLEHLFAQAPLQTERRVKVAVLQAIATLFFKRSFVVVRAGLADADPTVVGQAVEAVGAFLFEHAFDPLARLVRESSNPAARGAALGAMAQMDTADAAELLLGVLEHGSHADRAVAVDALKKSTGARFTQLAREVLSTTSRASQPELHGMLAEVLAARGRG